MYSLLHAAVHLLLLQQVARAQWVDRPALDPTSTTSADFTIATVPNEPPNAMEGVIYDVYPTTTAAETLAAAIATGAAKATAVAASAATAIASGSPKDDDKGECRLLGPFALFVQLALGALALTSLVYKRWRERPQRPLKIWFFDASKQVFGSVLVHVANVFMSMLTSGRFSIKVEPAAVATTAAVMMKRMAASEGDGGDAGEYVPNPCSFYLLNLAIDVSCSRTLCCSESWNHRIADFRRRPQSAYLSSSSCCVSSRKWRPIRHSASLPSRSNPGTTAARQAPGGG